MPDASDPPTGRRWLAEVVVVPKAGVNDPEGHAILGGLRQLGHDEVERVRAGRLFEVAIVAEDARGAKEAAETMCDRLLANPVIESYRVTVRERPVDAAEETATGGWGR